MRQTSNQSKILVFLPQAAAAMVVGKLAECGYVAVAVSTVPEAFDALRSKDFAFAVTTRPDIDLVRNIRAIPVINIEVFFHNSTAGGDASKRFDSKAFLERVGFLANPVPARPNSGSGQTASAQIQVAWKPRWWSIAANALRLPRYRKGLMDVQS
ncbi:hypothetical protein H009_17693 [Agrobacterium tumefaciens str. Cherry 2E-2-2]|uniref:Uncharacterized protein n=2 Tax=Agrobacterium TaxID=357 RepID=A0A1S7R7L5_9HYPH|nr:MULTISPECIES: hypothetical protein [Agrobacterium]EMS96319.1 hypothetical protein H009_17693 [Agrobacterium tumefaciens str. Cherry 2E-2-2]AYM82152.1 hypothetical protein At12D1_22650 [Agrobacterium tumefaciens]NTE90337.1 hypothetical protein [Agrobacterium tumefaciens]CUX17856.1 conserved hypothetical protein [Agrobacterium tumefaciens str. Kerr 14]CUX48308.1 conserved hypothetical protein [Agrobacterium deltaense Zutra 3/1]